MAIISMHQMKKIINPVNHNTPEDDFKILNSWTETEKNGNKLELKYFCYKINTINPETGKSSIAYKAVKFARVERLPKSAKQSTSFMDMQAQILSAVYQQKCNLVTVIANVIRPVPEGLMYLYGVQGVSTESIEEAKKIADYDFNGFIRSMMGTFRVLHIRPITAEEGAWLREKMRGMKFMTAVRGIPKASKSGEDAGNKGIGGANINPDSQGTLEEIITAMADYEYVIEILSTPVYERTLQSWSTQTQKDMTNWYGQMQGTKGLNFNLSLPMTYMSSVSNGQGWSRSYSDSRTLSFTKGESYNMGYSESVGQSLSQSFGQSFGVSKGHSITDSVGQNYSVSQGVSRGHSIGTTEGITRGRTIGETLGYTQGMTRGYTQGLSRGVSSGVSVSQTMGNSLGSSVGSNRGVSLGQSLNTSQNTGFNSSLSQGVSSNSSKSTTLGSSQSQNMSQSLNKSFGENSGIGHSVGSSENASFGTSNNYSAGGSQSVSQSRGSSSSFGYGHSDGDSSSTGISATDTTNSGLTVGGGPSGFNVSGNWSNGNSLGLTNSAGMTSGDSINRGFGSSVSSGTSSGTSWSASTGNSQSFSAGSNESYSSSRGSSYSEGYGASYGTGNSISYSNGVSEGSGRSLGFSQGSSGSIGTSRGTNYGQSAGTSASQNAGQSYSVSISQNKSTSLTSSMSQSVSASESISKSQSTSDSMSRSYSQSSTENVSQSQSESSGTSRSKSVGETEGQSYTQSLSNGLGQNWGQSNSVSTGQSTGSSEGQSTGTSLGNTGSFTTGTSGSMGIGASIGYSKSYQWLDQQVKDIVEILEFQNERIKKAILKGAFYTYVYIACPSMDVLAVAQASARSTWQNSFALAQPVQALDLTDIEQQHLLYHFAAFSADITKENIAGMTDYKYATVLLPDEYVAYTHLPRVSEGGIDTNVDDIPKFRVPGFLRGNIYMGTQLNSERYTLNNGYRTQFDYRISIDELMHGVFTGQSRSGKTVAAMRFIRELANSRRTETGKRLRLVIMDPKQDWRGIARFVEPERFRFYSMGNTHFRPINLNPCKIPVGVEPQHWIDGIINIYCRAYGLLERGKQMMSDVFYALYLEAGVFREEDAQNYPTDMAWKEELSRRSGTVTFHKIYKRMEQLKESLAGPGKKVGNDTMDAYARLLERLSCFSRPFSIEYRLFSQETDFNDPNSDGLGQGIDELIGKDDVTVFESFGLESTFANFIFGIITSGFYKVAKGFERGFLHPDQYETVLVIEEANKVLTGNDTAGTGSSDSASLSGQSEFEEILDQSAGYGLFIIAITQKISMMPSSIIANCGLLFIGKISQPEDVDLAVRMIGREGRIDDRDVVKWFPKSPTGWFICRSNRGYDFKDAEPVLVQIEPLNNAQISNAELDEILTKKEVAILLNEDNKEKKATV